MDVKEENDRKAAEWLRRVLSRSFPSVNAAITYIVEPGDKEGGKPL